ncbi:MAG: VirB4-like conjugal transfer ATPase, CD1110 family [Eubacterium sp.]
MLGRGKASVPLTRKIVKVPDSVQASIPIQRISQEGIFELENRGGNHQYDKAYFIQDINFLVQDEEEKEFTDQKYRMVLNSMNLSFKIIVTNQHVQNQDFFSSLQKREGKEHRDALGDEYREIVRQRIENGRNGLMTSKILILSCNEPDFKSAKRFFETLEGTLQLAFKKMGSGLISMNASERLRALHSFYRLGKEKKFSFDWDEYLFLKRDWRNDIVNTFIREKKDYLELDGKRIAQTLFVSRYPANIGDDFVREVTKMPFPLIYTIDCEPFTEKQAEDLIYNRYMANQVSMNTEQEKQMNRGNFATNVSFSKRIKNANMEDMLTDLRTQNEKLYMVGMTFLIQGKDREELKQRRERLIHLCDGYTTVSHSYQQLDALNTTLPTGARFVHTMRSLITPSLSIFTPFNVQEVNMPDGYCYGVNSLSRNMILGNRKKLPNSNGMVFGDSGGGKSMNEKFEMGQVLAFSDDDIIIVDPMAEYRDICQIWQGEYINLSKSKDNVCFMNPFHVPDEIPDRMKFLEEKEEFAYAICEQALKEIGALNNKHVLIIGQAVKKMYNDYFSTLEKKKTNIGKDAVPMPTLRVLRNTIKEIGAEKEAAKELVEQLEVFTDGALNIFSKEQTTSGNNRLTVYGLSNLGPRMRPMAMLIMLESITSKIKYNQSIKKTTWVYIDEVQELWKEEYSLLALQRMWAEVRKQGGICTGITQNLSAAMDFTAVETMISNSKFKVLLNQGSCDRDRVMDLFKLSETQMKYIDGADPGNGLVFFDTKIVPFDNEIPKDNVLYRMFNTNLHEIAEQEKEKTENG